MNLEGKILHGMHIGVKDAQSYIDGKRDLLYEDLYIVGEFDSELQAHEAKNPLCYYADKIFIKKFENKLEILTFSKQDSFIRSCDYAFSGNIDSEELFSTTGVFNVARLSEDLSYECWGRGDLVNFMAIRELPNNVSLEDLGYLGSMSKLNYEGIKEFKDYFKIKLKEWMIEEGNGHIQHIKDEIKMMKEYDEKNEQDTYSEMRRIFPEHLLKKTLSIDNFLQEFISGLDIEEDENKPLSHYVDNKLYTGGAERMILKNYAIETKEVYDYSPIEVPKYSLTDIGVDMMTKFLGCIPEESERCYSIIRYMSEKNKNSGVPLGTSASDMRDYIRWMTNPGQRIMLMLT